MCVGSKYNNAYVTWYNKISELVAIKAEQVPGSNISLFTGLRLWQRASKSFATIERNSNVFTDNQFLIKWWVGSNYTQVAKAELIA